MTPTGITSAQVRLSSYMLFIYAASKSMPSNIRSTELPHVVDAG